MKPFCMFTGSKDSQIYQWLASKGITMIQVCIALRLHVAVPFGSRLLARVAAKGMGESGFPRDSLPSQA